MHAAHRNTLANLEVGRYAGDVVSDDTPNAFVTVQSDLGRPMRIKA